MNQQLISLTNKNIPANLQYFNVSENVVSISKNAFDHNRETLTAVDFNSPYLKEIGDYAFEHCKLIEVVDLRNCSSLISIGMGSFQKCYYLYTVYINEELEFINFHAFNLCYSLTSMIIPKNSKLKIMKENFICETKLKYFYVPQYTYEIMFSNARYLEIIEIHPNNYYYSFNNSCFMNYKQEILWNCFHLDPKAVIYLPETIVGIEAYAFLQTHAKKIVFPKTLTWMKMYAFHRCQVQEYDFSNVIAINEVTYNVFEYSKIKYFNFSNVTNLEINHKAFLSCEELEEVALSPSCIYIGLDAFKSCVKLRKINIPLDGKLQRIVNNAFAYTSLEEFVITSSLQFIGLNAFEGVQNMTLKCDPNNLYFSVKDNVLFFDKSTILIWYPPYLRNESYRIPSPTTTLRSYCFYKAFYLKELFFPVQLTKILQHAVFCTNITNIKLPSLVTNIEMYAFASNWNLETIDFGDTIKLIPKFVLSDCINLKYIYIPPSVTYVRQKAFENCRSLLCVSCGKNLVNILAHQIPVRIIHADGRCSLSENEIIVL